ncbi:UBN2 domain-containing protein [Cephalotus follicularis]|uniref:UBN2 domain-containing protein n=1 Tax=Cephalotus follicularis TaxID=3775 RepID=A0A1Q3BRD7_CEPFO|nr:UBN2 domain-containing protein [Cephalotus follicularis]
MMHDYESISDMFTRFTTIINALKNLGKSYPNQELVRKILRCLPKSWTEKDFQNFPQDEESSKREEPTCYECNKPSHFKNECPNLKKKEQFKKRNEYVKKKKAMVATWSDSDPSSSEEESDEELAHIAFMAIEDEEENEVNFTFEELQNAYEKLYVEYENVCLKNKTLKKNAISISNELETLKSENIKYLNKIEYLKDKNSFYMNEIDILNVLQNSQLTLRKKIKS